MCTFACPVRTNNAQRLSAIQVETHIPERPESFSAQVGTLELFRLRRLAMAGMKSRRES